MKNRLGKNDKRANDVSCLDCRYGSGKQLQSGTNSFIMRLMMIANC